jgi:hypothetical protein
MEDGDYDMVTGTHYTNIRQGKSGIATFFESLKCGVSSLLNKVIGSNQQPTEKVIFRPVDAKI